MSLLMREMSCRYDVGELETRLGVDLELEALSDYESNAVLIAETIDADVPIAAEEGDKEFSGDSSGYDLGVTIDDIVAEPEQYVGLTVTVSDEVEEHLLMPHSFLLGDEALLAGSKAPQTEFFVEATTYVTGEVRLFNLKEIEGELGIDLDDGALRIYEGRPVIAVDSLMFVK
jgi:hypothetical protein